MVSLSQIFCWWLLLLPILVFASGLGIKAHGALQLQTLFKHFRFDLDFWEWVLEIGWYRYWNVMYIVMVAMVFHAANNALSAYGTFTQNRIILIVSVIIRYNWFLWMTSFYYKYCILQMYCVDHHTGWTGVHLHLWSWGE